MHPSVLKARVVTNLAIIWCLYRLFSEKMRREGSGVGFFRPFYQRCTQYIKNTLNPLTGWGCGGDHTEVQRIEESDGSVTAKDAEADHRDPIGRDLAERHLPVFTP
jgi:hypothetical protein